MHPKKSGPHTRRLVSSTVNVVIMASMVLMLNSRVPIDCVTAAHQSAPRGDQAQCLVGDWSSLITCRKVLYPAAVKNSDPRKKVMPTTRPSTNWA